MILQTEIQIFYIKKRTQTVDTDEFMLVNILLNPEDGTNMSHNKLFHAVRLH